MSKRRETISENDTKHNVHWNYFESLHRGMYHLYYSLVIFTMRWVGFDMRRFTGGYCGQL